MQVPGNGEQANGAHADHDEIRCGKCRRKLATGRYLELTIKCPRCRTLNHLKATSLEHARRRAPDETEQRRERSNSGPE
ncbi:Com family DNA-binding transcriptional regulator [Paraburkholderia sp. BR14263]|uniref:Com family DNA-binding transcriptional regulator n=1 Tax=unclassified Paraburkholderia TaxID=2615204 RepID=UPI0034CE660A